MAGTIYGLPSDGSIPADLVGTEKDAADTWQDVSRRTRFLDEAGANGSLVDVEHNGDGSGNAGQTYGLDIHNNPGARSAFVIHQYSSVQAAVQIDNTDSNSAVLIKNTNNTTKNPAGAASGTSASGNFFRCIGTDGTPYWTLMGRGEIFSTPPADATAHAIEVVGNATSNKKLLRLDARGPGIAAEILAQAGAAGFYPLTVTGYDYGPRFTTSQNGSGRSSLRVEKMGTGTGEAVIVVNQGTGATLSLRTAPSTEVAKFRPNGELELMNAGAGVILRSPNGTAYRLTVGDDGAVGTAPA